MTRIIPLLVTIERYYKQEQFCVDSALFENKNARAHVSYLVAATIILHHL